MHKRQHKVNYPRSYLNSVKTKMTKQTIYNRVQKCFGNTFSHSSPTFFPFPLSNVDYLYSITLCNTKSQFSTLIWGKGRVSSHIAEKLGEKVHFPKIFTHDCLNLFSHKNGGLLVLGGFDKLLTDLFLAAI